MHEVVGHDRWPAYSQTYEGASHLRVRLANPRQVDQITSLTQSLTECLAKAHADHPTEDVDIIEIAALENLLNELRFTYWLYSQDPSNPNQSDNPRHAPHLRRPGPPPDFSTFRLAIPRYPTGGTLLGTGTSASPFELLDAPASAQPPVDLTK